MTVRDQVQITYKGDGTTKLFTFPFEYIHPDDIDVYLWNFTTESYDLQATNTWSFANATTIEFNSAPPVPTDPAVFNIKIARSTELTKAAAVFYPGSAIRAQDLNDNFEQSLFLVQESWIASEDASLAAKEATEAARVATGTANTALSTANTALSNSVTALNTANAADSKATTALSTATTADANATTALNAVSSAVQYTIVPNVAAIPSNPTAGQSIEVANSTGIEGFTPLSGVPAGFVGDPGLSVRIQYNAGTSSWGWLLALAVDPDTRYLRLIGDTMTGDITFNGSQTFPVGGIQSADTSQPGVVQLSSSTASTSEVLAATPAAVKAAYDLANTKLAQTGGQLTGGTSVTVQTLPNGSAWTISDSNIWEFAGGDISNPAYSLGGDQTGVLVITGAITSWGSNFKFVEGNPVSPTTFPAVIPYLVRSSSEILIGPATEGLA